MVVGVELGGDGIGGGGASEVGGDAGGDVGDVVWVAVQ